MPDATGPAAARSATSPFAALTEQSAPPPSQKAYTLSADRGTRSGAPETRAAVQATAAGPTRGPSKTPPPVCCGLPPRAPQGSDGAVAVDVTENDLVCDRVCVVDLVCERDSEMDVEGVRVDDCVAKGVSEAVVEGCCRTRTPPADNATSSDESAATARPATAPPPVPTGPQRGSPVVPSTPSTDAGPDVTKTVKFPAASAAPTASEGTAGDPASSASSQAVPPASAEPAMSVLAPGAASTTKRRPEAAGPLTGADASCRPTE